MDRLLKCYRRLATLKCAPTHIDKLISKLENGNVDTYICHYLKNTYLFGDGIVNTYFNIGFDFQNHEWSSYLAHEILEIRACDAFRQCVIYAAPIDREFIRKAFDIDNATSIGYIWMMFNTRVFMPSIIEPMNELYNRYLEDDEDYEYIFDLEDDIIDVLWEHLDPKYKDENYVAVPRFCMLMCYFKKWIQKNPTKFQALKTCSPSDTQKTLDWVEMVCHLPPSAFRTVCWFVKTF